MTSSLNMLSLQQAGSSLIYLEHVMACPRNFADFESHKATHSAGLLNIFSSDLHLRHLVGILEDGHCKTSEYSNGPKLVDALLNIECDVYDLWAGLFH